MLECKTLNELLRPTEGFTVSDLLLLSYSVNPRFLETAVRDAGLCRTYNTLSELAGHILCIMQEDRASGAWDDKYVNTVAQYLLHSGRVLGFSHNNDGDPSFHPKLTVAVMQNQEGTQRIRLIIGSRNLTSERYLESAVCLEGVVSKDRQAAPAVDPKGLSALLEKLREKFSTVSPFLNNIDSLCNAADFSESLKKIIPGAAVKNSSICSENLSCTFDNDWKSAEKAVIFSPFLHPEYLKKHLELPCPDHIHIYANPSDYTKEMEGLLKDYSERVKFWIPKSTDGKEESNDSSENAESENISGVFLHAKMYALDLADHSVLYIGSANFSENGFTRNTELLVRIKATSFSFVDALNNAMRERREKPKETWDTRGDEMMERRNLPSGDKDNEKILKELDKRYENEREQDELTDFVYQLFEKTVRGAPLDFAIRKLLSIEPASGENAFAALRKRVEDTVTYSDLVKRLREELIAALDSMTPSGGM